MYCAAETENIGKAHISSAHRMLEELDKSLKDFREQQRELRKKVMKNPSLFMYVFLLCECVGMFTPIKCSTLVL